jgi:hypothetical protein
MKTIWKFPLEVGGATIGQPQGVEMPGDAEILMAGNQGDFPTLWAMVETENPLEIRQFVLVSTGFDIGFLQPLDRYWGTAVTFEGELVWHVWEVDR